MRPLDGAHAPSPPAPDEALDVDVLALVDVEDDVALGRLPPFDDEDAPPADPGNGGSSKRATSAHDPSAPSATPPTIAAEEGRTLRSISPEVTCAARVWRVDRLTGKVAEASLIVG